MRFENKLVFLTLFFAISTNLSFTVENNSSITVIQLIEKKIEIYNQNKNKVEETYQWNSENLPQFVKIYYLLENNKKTNDKNSNTEKNLK